MNPDILTGKTEEHLAKTGEFAGVLHQSVVEPFQDLASRAADAGFDLCIISGFRGFERQLKIWNAKVKGERAVLDDNDQQLDLTNLSDLQKIQAIMRFSALPGGSRHHWGTDVDVYDAQAIDDGYQVQLIHSETVDGGRFSELHRWLDIELPKTGFYRPYELDTGGVSVEAWHLSYRPLAAGFSEALTTKALLDSYRGVEIELIDSIKDNIDTLFERFVRAG